MANPNFTRLQNTWLYLPEGTTPQQARSGYLLPTTVTEPPPTISLGDSLQTYAGWYLYFPVLPYSDVDPSLLTDFIGAVQTFLTGRSQRLTRFLWIFNPQTATSGISGMTLPATLQGGVWTIQQGQFLDLTPNTQLRISGGTQIKPSDDGTALVFTAATGAPNVLLVTPNGQQSQQTIAITGNITLAEFDATLTPFGGATLPSGCFTLGTAPDLDELAYLGTGLRYFASDLNPDDPPGLIKALPYPIFALAGTDTLPLFGVADPLDPLNAARTFFLFGSDGTPLTTPVQSYFRSTLNVPVTLTPQSSARLLFAIDVIAKTENGQPDPTNPYYLTPAGDFALAINNSGGQSGSFANYLMCGYSGVEYFDVPSGSTRITFQPGKPAFSQANVSATTLLPVYSGLTGQGMTSWAYLDGGESYYAQPDSSVLHQPNARSSPFLSYLPALSGQLLTPNGVQQSFPLAPYAGVQPAAGLNYADFETQVLNPSRRNQVYEINPNYGTSNTPPQATASGTTMQGGMLQLESGDWEVLTLAQTPDAAPATTTSKLQLSNVQGALRAAMQTNQMFMVVSSGSKLLENAAIPNYRLTIQSWTDLEQSQNPVVPSAILTKLKPLEGQLFTSLSAYQSALQNTLGSDYATYANVLVQVGASFGVTIQSWWFDFSPYFWQEFNTLVIFKFINSPFIDLVNDTGSWTRAADLNDDPSSTQQSLLAFIKDAQQSTDPNLDYFRQTVLGDPSWNGVLVLRCRVPLSSLPAEIEGLAAGIDPSQFYAHHIGITVTPVVAGANQTLTVQNSTLFGLINYNDPTDLSSTTADYQYKVLNLAVLFVNSEINNFSSVIELLVNRLFAEPATLQGSAIGNNLKLTGVYQKHGDSGSYVFQNQDNNVFQITSQVLNQVVINEAQFITVVPPGGEQIGQNVQTRFSFTGYLTFQALPGFDIFSFGTTGNESTGGLVYSALSVDLSFPPDNPSYQTFSFDAQRIAFNTALSVARPDSLYPRFPLKLTGLVQAKQGQTPATLNYMPVDSPLTGSLLSGTWFGLVFDLNLGSLGALAGQLGFVASLLLSWQPNTKKYTVYVGLQIPGATGGKREISLEGVIKLVFGDVRFVVAGQGAYILQLRNIALSLLSISFPPGQTDLLLFGDPTGKDNSTLGWYAAYLKANQGGGSKSKESPKLLVPGDRVS
ncbi:MAG: hypothetical protein ABI977_25445 [Acidobacteriota bacterium]